MAWEDPLKSNRKKDDDELKKSFDVLARVIVVPALTFIGKKVSANQKSFESLGDDYPKFEDGFSSLFSNDYRMKYSSHYSALLEHFSLMKEVFLYAAYLQEIGISKEMWDRVYILLTDYLSEGLSFSQAEYRQHCRELLFNRFLDELKSGKDIRSAIKYTYWDTLIDKHPDLFTKSDVYSWDLMPSITKFLFEAFLVENEFVSKGCWEYIYKE